MKHKLSCTVSAAALLCTLLITACGEQTPAAPVSNDTTPINAPSVTDAAETEPAGPVSLVPDDLDFGGKTVTLLGGDSAFSYYTESTALDGDSMNDALFNRYQVLKERLNIDMAFDPNDDGSAAVRKLNASVLAGEDLYYLCFMQRATNIAKMVGDHILDNWNDLPYIDLSLPFWYHDAIDSLRIDDSVFYTYGDIYPLSTHCFFYNKRLVDLYDLPVPYECVLNGTWTMDLMYEEARAVVKDLNGDGKMDADDQYGMSFWNNDTICSFMFGSGVTLTSRKDGTVVLNPCEDKTVAVYEKMTKFFGENISYTKKMNEIKIDSDRVLFYTNCVHFARQFRDSDVDFGMLPYPKFDEKQENYISFLNTELMCIPATADPELAGAVVQMLAENSAGVKEAYYELLLKDKISRDPQSAQMLDIIFEHAVNDFAISFADGARVYPVSAQKAIKQAADFVSAYEKQMKMGTKAIDDALNKIYSYE